MKQDTFLGIMSGTSLDGIDLLAVKFEIKQNLYSFELLAQQTIEHHPNLLKEIKKARQLNGLDLSILNNNLGDSIGQNINNFINKNTIHIDYICSHGHTVFHQPEKNLTLQIGSGANIYAKTGITTICDFRSVDVALNGQGAPLVPIGDLLLFSSFDACINLGGISNISKTVQGKRLAYDISACNLLLNHLALKKGKAYDKNGSIGLLGSKNEELFNQLNDFEYFNKTSIKSLGIEWIEKNQLPLLKASELSIEDQFASVYHHIGFQIAKHIESSNTLITGGGAHNNFLYSLIEKYSGFKIKKADPVLIDFKEALIFAFLGYLRVQNKNNCIQTVTGAAIDNLGGAIYGEIPGCSDS